ncbi:DNA repair protein XRCC3 [Thrips palmi]|uniref:DNA repair protein XRCC3 n=1 Tax=Thrips palmi TaxID=161013 RepID=A0A6P8ZDL8_THRPL|nr:DNA repair protein XRCC3 [Thrips palmi]
MAGTKLSDKHQEELKKADIRGPGAVLQVSEFGLLRIGSLNSAEADSLSTSAAATVLNPGFTTALESENSLEKWKRLSTGCHILDHALGGGFPARGITELAGESGCGKTQLCLQLCLGVQYSQSQGGFNSGAVYICTEDSFPTNRLQQLFHTYSRRRGVCGSAKNFGDNIFIEHIADAAGMRQCVLGRLPKLMTSQRVGLIVIDSVAGIFRSSYENNEIRNRAEDMRVVAGQLHKIAAEYGVCIICVNQVTASDGPERCIPALGLAWSNLVTTRIQLHLMEPNGIDGAPHRSLQVVFAPDLPEATVPYTVSEAGVFGLS